MAEIEEIGIIDDTEEKTEHSMTVLVKFDKPVKKRVAEMMVYEALGTICGKSTPQEEVEES